MKKVNNERIRSIRMELKMNHEEFARALGVQSMVVHHWENDRVRPSAHALRTIEALARSIIQR